ncbi:MAG: AI-2E family transporter [Pseudomonadota bacterium]|nr:AI-2E family transporter [Pseudomonadota bacterium]
MLSQSHHKILLFISLLAIEILFLSTVFIGLDHFIYPVCIATILLYIALPAIEALENYLLIPRIAAIFLIFSIQVSFIIYLLFTLLPSLVLDLQNLLQNLPINIKKSISLINRFTQKYDVSIFPDIGSLEKNIIESFTDYIKPTSFDLAKTLTVAHTTAGQLISPIYWLADLFLIPILFIFLGLNYQKILQGITCYTPNPYKADMNKLLMKMNTIFAGYLRGQVILITILTISYCVGFSLIELPHAIVIGIVTGVLSFVPYLGTTVGIITSLINLAAMNSSTLSYVSLFLVFAVVHGTESVILIPHLIGNSVGLNVFTSFLSILIGANMFGMVGILFAIPTTAILKYLFLELYGMYQREEIV